MSRLKLIPDPSFAARVSIPVPGKKPVEVEFTFKYRSRDEVESLCKMLDTREDNPLKTDTALIMAVASGWELVDEFNKENVDQFVQSYIAAPALIFEAYLKELTGNRQKN